jgi:hypothetical protein
MHCTRGLHWRNHSGAMRGIYGWWTMTLDLNNPESIREWLKVAPERHKAILRVIWKRNPQFRATIEQATKQA